MGRPWRKKSSEYLADYPVFKLRKDVCVSPRTGRDMSVYVLESREWTNIIPLTPDEQVVMVRQYRFGTEEVTLEIPGGLIDRQDGSYLEASRREMREETGYDTEMILPLGVVRPNPAILNNRCHIFLAQNVVKLHEQDLDAGEDIRVELVPLAEIPRLIVEGTINHSLVLNAFYLFDMHRRRGTV